MMEFGRRPLVLGLSLVVLFVAGCGGGSGPGGPNSSDEGVGVDLIAQSTLPTNGQEILPDLSDVDGVIQVKFSERLAKNTVLDANNAFNGLSSDVNFLDSSFSRVPGTPSITGERSNVLTFVPAGGVLPNGQYTITATRDVRSSFGGRLNRGLYDFRSSFTVGTDVFSPVIRNTFPAPNQRDVPKDSQVIITFNESLNPATITNATVTVVDGGANPPVAISGTLKTSRDDFDIVFTPDPGTGLPPNATIVVTLTGGAGGITDVVGNPFEGDPATPGTYQFQFSTVIEPPPPNNPIMVDIVNGDGLVAVGTLDSLYTVAEWGYAGTYDLTNWALSGPGVPNPIPNSKRKIGQPGEIVMDQRFGPGDGHSWMYVIDRKSRSVTIVGTRDNKVVYRWRNLPDPRGLAINRSGLQLYVTNYGADTVSILDIASVTPGGSQPTTVLKELTNLRKPNDPAGKGRLDLQVGRGPTGAAHAPDGNFLYVANSLDNTCTRIDTGAGKVLQTWQTGTSPQDIGATFFIPINIGWFVFVTCLGGGSDETGSVSLGWFAGVGPNDLQANIGGFQNPKGVIYDFGLGVYVTNSGGDTVTDVQITIAGGGFAATILPVINNTVKVGRNPSSVTVDPLGLAVVGTPMAIITADRGSSQLSFIYYPQPVRPTFTLAIPGAQEVASYWDQ